MPVSGGKWKMENDKFSGATVRVVEYLVAAADWPWIAQQLAPAKGPVRDKRQNHALPPHNT